MQERLPFPPGKGRSGHAPHAKKRSWIFAEAPRGAHHCPMRGILIVGSLLAVPLRRQALSIA
jgi:hypothetical protein